MIIRSEIKQKKPYFIKPEQSYEKEINEKSRWKTENQNLWISEILADQRIPEIWKGRSKGEKKFSREYENLKLEKENRIESRNERNQISEIHKKKERNGRANLNILFLSKLFLLWYLAKYLNSYPKIRSIPSYMKSISEIPIIGIRWYLISIWILWILAETKITIFLIHMKTEVSNSVHSLGLSSKEFEFMNIHTKQKLSCRASFPWNMSWYEYHILIPLPYFFTIGFPINWLMKIEFVFIQSLLL